VVLRDPEVLAATPAPVRHAAGEAIVDTLADLHALDPGEVGLGDLARHEGYVERVLRRWRGQWEKSKTRELPLLDEVAGRLGRRIPEQGPARIVHGDYRLDNAIISPDDGRVQAVLDWELCTLGDPLADLGLLLVYWTEPDDEDFPLTWSTIAGGFPSRCDVASRYAARSGRDLSEIDYYVALGLWKLAVILEGVHARYAAGASGGNTDDAWRSFDKAVPRLAEKAHEATRRAGR
jgi:aminoglycoside phosphotransferase (APT) family kinase protein